LLMKRHCLANWIKKKDPTICCLQEPHWQKQAVAEGENWKKIYLAKGPWKQAGVEYLSQTK
jgi:hypothetical protein